MDLLVALSIVVWAVGGVFCASWIFWLDRDRRELPFALKASTIVSWPLMFPYLLYLREDLSPLQAGRGALIWLALLSPGFLGDLLTQPPPRALERPRAVDLSAFGPVSPPPRPVRPMEPVVPRAAPSEDDKREAVRYWNSGIIFYQKGDYEAASDAWRRCAALDPSNSDCATGLQRIDQAYGSTLASAVR